MQCEQNVWAAGRSQDRGHDAIQRSVLTNQCLGKETPNAEPPGRGIEESFLTDSVKLI
jgi:hypothetical protein